MEESMEKLLTVEEVMKTLRISRPTLYRLLKSGKLEPVRIGKRVLFEMAEIRAFIGRSRGGEGQQEEPKKLKKQAGRKPPKQKEKPEQEGKTRRRRKAEQPEAPKEEKPEVAEKPKSREKVQKPPKEDDKQGRLL